MHLKAFLLMLVMGLSMWCLKRFFVLEDCCSLISKFGENGLEN